MTEARRPGWILGLVAIAALAADQASKYAITKFTEPGSLHEIIPGVLNLVHTTNPGVAFGLFADSQMPWRAPVLIGVSVAVIALIVWLLVTHRAGGPLSRWGVTLVMGGAAGNVLDRIVRRSVTDFIDVHIASYHWYTFNVADTAIVVGAGLIILELLRDGRRPHHESA